MAADIRSDPLRERIAASDLRFTDPAPRSEDGLPIGNGRMGSLVWTSPSRLRFQLNRVDVYASNAESDSFYEPHNDYCGGCGFVDIEFEGRPFAGTVTQHLSVYDGVLTIDCADLSVRIVPSRTHDVFAVAIHDRRARVGAVSVILRMLRYETKYLARAQRARRAAARQFDADPQQSGDEHALRRTRPHRVDAGISRGRVSLRNRRCSGIRKRCRRRRDPRRVEHPR